MIELTLTAHLTVDGPFLCRTGTVGSAGLDAVAMISPKGQAVIPGTQVKGLLREALYELVAVEPAFLEGAAPGSEGPPRVEDLLGPPSNAEDGASTPLRRERGMLSFSDFLSANPVGARTTRARIRRDRARAATSARHLQLIEAATGSGDTTTFTGTIRARVATSAQADALTKAVGTGIRWTTSLGAFRSVGFGRIRDVQVDVSALEVRRMVGRLPDADVLDFAMSFSEPFCFAKRRLTENLFESDDVISGGAIKGALASMLNSSLGRPAHLEISGNPGEGATAEFAGLASNFSCIRISHAFPTRSAQRPRRVPFSMVRSVDGDLLDASLVPTPFLIAAKPADGGSGASAAHPSAGAIARAPIFAVDWIDDADARSLVGWPSVNRELRVRTAIDPGTRCAADGQLFGYEMISPDPDGLSWRGRIDLRGVGDASTRAKIRASLAQVIGLDAEGKGRILGLGKTKAQATLCFAASTYVAPPSTPLSDGQPCWTITLQTAALLCPPSGWRGRELHAVWEELSGGALTLVRHFARQSLIGGYLGRRAAQERRRLRSSGANSRGYLPFLLTDPGSVFVLRKTGRGDAAKALVDWATAGLPIPKWAKALGLDDWRACPFQPENGYGEILLNDPLHEERKPKRPVPVISPTPASESAR